MARSLSSSFEALEARIAPANLSIQHPLLDVVAGIGKTGLTIDLGALVDPDPAAGYRTHVEFTTNFDTDTVTPGLQAGKLILELFDEKAPLTVQNFLGYVNNLNDRGDFDGVYFHRLVSGFVLQTGGFEATKLGAHIPVGEEVHNEFDPNDPERSNTVGTVAMAKVGFEDGGGPNSATSEFFFNLGNNSANLDNQNGGFTVFGKVVQGMDVVNAIASLSTLSLAGSPTPVHNGYVSDPDFNPNTPPPVPKPSQVVQFTSAKVLPAKNSTVPHAVYGFEITDSMGGSTDLVTGSIIGDTLTLKYKPGATGVATVTVQVNDATDPTNIISLPEQQFQVTVKPNLVAEAGVDQLPLYLVSGDAGLGSVKLVNTGGATASGNVDVKFFLSRAAGADPTGRILDATDVPIGSITGATINIPSGKTASLSTNLSIPDIVNLETGNYRILAQVTSPDGSVAELFTDDNIARADGTHVFVDAPAAPNLTTIQLADNLPALIVPGDTGLVKLAVGNSAGKTAFGDVLVSFFLSFDDLTDNVTDTLDSSDILIGQVAQSNVNIVPGRTVVFDAQVQIPSTLEIADGFYRIIGLVTSPNGSQQIVELNSGDNAAVGNYHVLQHTFGTVTFEDTQLGTISRTNAVLKYTLGSGDEVSLQMSGKGFGTLRPSTGGGVDVLLEGTDLKSSFSVGAPAGIRPIFVNIFSGLQQGTPIGNLALGNVDFSNSVIAFGGARNITLGNTVGNGDHFLGIGASELAIKAKVKPIVKLGNVHDLALESNLTIASLTANKWLDVNATTETVKAPGLVAFKVTGNFEADMNISADLPTSTAAVKSFVVGGSLKNSVVRVAGNVGSVVLGSINSSDFLVGTNIVPTALQDFNYARTIASVMIIGGANAELSGFVDSNIAAARFGKIAVNVNIAGDTGVDDFGFVADRIAYYQRGLGTVPLRNLDAPAAAYDPEGQHYQVTVLA